MMRSTGWPARFVRSARALAFVPLLAGSVWPLRVGAQGAEGAMGQGQALINVRSDVKLGIKGTGGTTRAHLQELGEAVAARMPDVRACYGELVAKRPATVGAIAVRMTLDPGAEVPVFEIKEKDGTDPELTECVKTRLGKGSFAEVGRPAAGIITLDFQNSRAQGQAAMAEHRAKAEVMEVRAAGGGFEAGWSTHDGGVSFTVRGASSPAVEAVARDFRDHVALFVDCRRRARKGDKSPAGTTQVEVRIGAGGVLEASVRSASLEPVGRCMDKTLKNRVAAGAPAGQRVSAEVRFAP